MGFRGGNMSNTSSKRRHYSTLLLLALGAAMLSVTVLHKLREGRLLGLLLQDRELQILKLHMILEKERAHSKEMKTKMEELKAKAVSLRSQKMQLNNRLMDAENLAAYLKNKREELESALEERQNKLSSLKDVEEASNKASLQVTALTNLLKERQDRDAEEMEHSLQQPSNQPVNATLADDISSNRNETDENTSKEEIADSRDDDAQSADGAEQVENSELEQGSKTEEWVKLETNTDEDNSTDEQDQEKEQVSEEGKHLEEGIQLGNQSAVEVVDENQINQAELLLNSTMDGERIPAMKDEVSSPNTSETNVGDSEGGHLEKDTGDDGEEKQTKDATGTSIRGRRRSRRTRSKGGKRRAAVARSWEHNTEASDSKDSQTGKSQQEERSKIGENPDQQVVSRNATQMNIGEVYPELPEDQTASEVAEVVEEKNQTDTVSLEASAGYHDDENSETKSASTESYQDTDGSEEKISGDNKNGFDSGEGGTISSSKESNVSESVQHETREENNIIRSTTEAEEERAASSEGGQEQNFPGAEEGESSGKEAEGDGKPGSEQLTETEEDDEEKKTSVSTAESIQQEVSATEITQREPEAENSAEDKSGDESKAEAATGGKSENEAAGEAKNDEGNEEDQEEF
uniref:Uncharacterized protein n=1 Tax=Anthurium amnicola TaxID=1678845 RepID=A0A1D1YJ20_9ARAE